jgi:hypothetical protein
MSSRAGKHPAPSPADTAAAVSVPVLMYHSTKDHPPRSTKVLSVHTDAFGRQLRRLCEQGFTGITFGELCARRRTGVVMPGKPVVITFDDGYADFYEVAGHRVRDHRMAPRRWSARGGPAAGADNVVGELAELTVNVIEVGAQPPPAAGPDPALTARRGTPRHPVDAGGSSRPAGSQPRLSVRVIKRPGSRVRSGGRLPADRRGDQHRRRSRRLAVPRASTHRP